MWSVYAILYNAEYNQSYTVLYNDITHPSLETYYVLLGRINKNISTYVIFRPARVWSNSFTEELVLEVLSPPAVILNLPVIVPLNKWVKWLSK